jgi:serine/threonine-protein kinase
VPLRPENWSRLSRLLSGDDPVGPLAVLGELITEAQLRDCLQEQRRRNPRPRLSDLLVERGLLSAEQVALLRRRSEDAEFGEPPAPVVRNVGRYGLVEELGVGGAGVVWKAWDPKLRRWVAIKQPRSDLATARERFLREAQAAAKVRHPHLMEVFEIGEDQGRAYIVMDYVEAKTLDQVSLDPRSAARLIADVCDAVQAMHAAGVLHRDVKPQNILVDGRGVPRLGDFGLAKIEGNEPLTVEGTLLGTPLYMSPEQAARKGEAVGPRTDVYGLGASLFHALARQPPFAAESSLETLFQKLMTESAPSPRAVEPSVPRDLDGIVRRALARDPKDRYASATELAEDLRRFLRDEPVLAQPPSSVQVAARWVRRNSTLAAVLGAALLAVGFGIAASAVAIRSQGEFRERQREYAEAREKGDASWAKAVGYARRGPAEEARWRAAAEEAIACFDRAGRWMPDDPYPWLMRGRCQALLGRESEADASWAEALRRRPSYGPAFLERGKRALGTGVPMRIPRRAQLRGGTVVFGPPDPEDDALRELRRRGEEDLESARRSKDLEKAMLAYLEGVLSLSGGDYGKAAESLAAYAEEYPWDAEGLLSLGIAQYYSMRFEAAEASFRKALDLGPQAARYKWLGDVRYCRGRWAEASASYGDAIALDPRQAAAWCNRGLAKQALRDLEGAKADYRKAIELRPSFARAHKCLGTALYDEEQWTEARRAFERAASLAELDAEAHYNLGSVLLRLKEIDEGIREFQAAAEIDPRYSDAHLGLGTALLMKGERDPAAESLEKAAGLDGANPEAHYYLALARWTQGDRTHAVEALERALASGAPDWPRRKEAEERLREWRK